MERGAEQARQEDGAESGAAMNPFSPQSEREHQSLVIEFNRSVSPYPVDKTVVELFEAQVERTPDDDAIRFGDQALTYRELNDRANQLAAHLRTLGVGLEQLVVLYMEHSVEVVCAIFGVLKTGGAYVPVDVATPKERLAFILQDIAKGLTETLPVLVTQSSLVSGLPNGIAQVVTLDADFASIVEYPVSDSRAPLSPNNIAYVIFTSGSTGTPKGVMIEHRSLVNYVWWANEKYCRGERLTWPLFSSLAFDLTVTSIFTPLISGGRIRVYREDPGVHGMVVFKVVEGNAVDIVKLTPAHLAMIKGTNLRATKIRKFVVGGEDFKTELAREITQAFGRPVEIYNEYGPTEATVGCMIHRYDGDNDLDPSVPIGIPAANTCVFLLDEHLSPVSVGAIGEMYIAGDGLARGYFNRPELTAEKFLTTTDPRQNGPAATSSAIRPASLRVYKTGDLARWSAKGNLEFLGRADHQVKIGGARIELGEIEARLLKHADVRECVVDVVGWDGKQIAAPIGDAASSKTGETSINRLVAYYVSEKPLRAAELRSHLAEELPAYMLPPHFIRLDRLPLTSNGKIDRKALPAPTADTLAISQDFVRPHTETEKALAVIWTELLKVESIGINDEFFDLGGHSLLAIRAVSRIRDVFGVDIPLEVMFAKPTIAGLANALAEAKGSGGGIQRIEQHEQGGVVPLSFAQEQLWFIAQLAPGSPVYNIVDVVPIRGRCDAEALRRAMKELVRRHEILRTAFSSSDRQSFQIVLPTVDLALPELDLSSLSEQERERDWTRVVREQGRKPFDLSQAPLLRGTLVHLSDQEHRLLLTTHHIIADEWSMEIIHQEVNQLYDAFSQGRPSPLPELPIQYADFAYWQRNWLQGEVLERQISYWNEALAGASSILELPADKPRPAVQSFRGATETFQVPEKLLDRLKSLGREEHATLFMILEAGFMALLHRYTGQDDILVGTPISGRTRSETETLIGLFLNTVLLRARFTDRLNFRSLLQQVRERALGAYAHPDLPFAHLVAELAPERDSSRTPFLQVMFILHNPEGVSQVSQASGNRELATGTSKFDLTLVLSETGNRLDGMIEYSTDLFEADTIRRLCGHYGTVLEAIARDPDQSISRLPLLTEAERQRLLVEWNATAAVFPEKALLHELFAAQVQRAPERIALRVGATALSYAELDTRATRLAQALRARGVGRGQRVGLCLERGADLLAAVLGILKAGAAYVPLDPAFPAERLRFMADDAQLALLVSTTALAGAFGSPRVRQLLLDADAESIAAAPATRPPSAADTAQPADPAYVIYTSGSTGQPKGVVVPHRAVVNFLTSMAREPGLTADDVLVAVTTLSFDIAVLELLLPLTLGATVVMASRDEASDGHALSALLAQHRATVMQATPVTWRLLLAAGWSGSTPFKALVGGEALPKDVADQLLARGVELWNLYGPTETTVWSTCARITDTANGITIGQPIANTTVYILDAQQNLCPIGVPGELCIGGAGVALGYWNRPALTAERFIPDPFRSSPGATLYRTGDRARRRHDGRLEHLGRLDDQVKVRGFRIELAEVEANLAEHPGVRQAAVHLWTVKANDVRIVACCVPAKAGALAPISLRKHLRARLPEYMIPQHFLLVDEIPLTPNGKVDRRRLPTPVLTESGLGRHEAPSDPVEATIAEIWTKLIEPARPIGRLDKFFEMGGHSLLGLQALRQIEDKLGVRLEFRVLFQESLADLATRCRSERMIRPSPDQATP
jgi:amino acid adenylation domain-containing protein